MLNVVRSAVTASTRRECKRFGEHSCLDKIPYRQASNHDAEDGPTTLGGDNANSINQFVSKIDRSRVPIVKEADLEEKFISGWGPGGQNVNKAVNCCQLSHRPTGILVKVHQSRSLQTNRKLARERIARKLDDLYNGEDSVASQSKRRALYRMSMRDKQAQKTRAMKEQFRSMLDNNTDF